MLQKNPITETFLSELCAKSRNLKAISYYSYTGPERSGHPGRGHDMSVGHGTINTSKSVNYSLKHEKALRMFPKSSEVPLNNNATEGELRSFCVHKQTWKLIDTIEGAKSRAIIYSIIETAKANRLYPFRYLEFLFDKLKEHQNDIDREFIEALLPLSEQLPETYRVK